MNIIRAHDGDRLFVTSIDELCDHGSTQPNLVEFRLCTWLYSVANTLPLTYGSISPFACLT
jgi:hypothetical protein